MLPAFCKRNCVPALLCRFLAQILDLLVELVRGIFEGVQKQHGIGLRQLLDVSDHLGFNLVVEKVIPGKDKVGLLQIFQLRLAHFFLLSQYLQPFTHKSF